ncbi:MAG: hypothetical protein ABIB43_03820 [archaeon]
MKNKLAVKAVQYGLIGTLVFGGINTCTVDYQINQAKPEAVTELYRVEQKLDQTMGFNGTLECFANQNENIQKRLAEATALVNKRDSLKASKEYKDFKEEIPKIQEEYNNSIVGKVSKPARKISTWAMIAGLGILGLGGIGRKLENYYWKGETK